MSHIVLALIEQSGFFKSQATSLLAVTASPEGQGQGVYPKKPRSPVVDELLKDVNDNEIKSVVGVQEQSQRRRRVGVSDETPSPLATEKSGQWDFLGDSNNNEESKTNGNNNETERSQQEVASNKKMEFIAEESATKREDGALSPSEVTESGEERIEEGTEEGENESSQPVVISSPASSSAAIDINCNIYITDNSKAQDGVMIVGSETSSVSPLPSPMVVKDLIDFEGDSSQHSAVSKVVEESSPSGGNNEQVEMFKLDEEETMQPPNEHVIKMPFLQMPDSPASIVSQQSTDADSGCEVYPNHDGSFSTPPPSSLAKRFKLSTGEEPPTTPLKSERSLSSESLNSETSVESNDSKSSIRLMSNRFSKNGTLERQSSSSSVVVEKAPQLAAPTGLQVLVLWNNLLTKKCGQAISDMIKGTSTLEVLNVGKNALGNEFVSAIKASLCANESISKLGLQSVQLTCGGVKTVAEVIESKSGSSSLTRVDLRDNNIQIPGLTAIHEAVRCNKSITQIDLNATPIDVGGAGEVNVN